MGSAKKGTQTQVNGNDLTWLEGSQSFTAEEIKTFANSNDVTPEMLALLEALTVLIAQAQGEWETENEMMKRLYEQGKLKPQVGKRCGISRKRRYWKSSRA